MRSVISWVSLDHLPDSKQGFSVFCIGSTGQVDWLLWCHDQELLTSEKRCPGPPHNRFTHFFSSQIAFCYAIHSSQHESPMAWPCIAAVSGKKRDPSSRHLPPMFTNDMLRVTVEGKVRLCSVLPDQQPLLQLPVWDNPRSGIVRFSHQQESPSP